MGRPTFHIEVDSWRIDADIYIYIYIYWWLAMGRPTFHIEIDSGQVGADIYCWLALGALPSILRLIVDG